MHRLAFWLALSLGGAASPTGAAPSVLWTGPYQDVSLAPAPLAAPAWLPAPAPGRVLVWAFATGTCGQERWRANDDAASTEAFARAGVAEMLRRGQDYVVSTGGEAAGFLCDNDADFARFVARYQSPRLKGIDFDIERQQTPAQIDALAARLAFAHRTWPALRLSVTLATHAASDGSGRNLNATGDTVLAALQRHGVAEAVVVNLMVMNYGPADARWCVVKAGRCDMGASALQAARNLHEQRGVPYARIALTLMPGENDVAGNVSTPDDARTLMAGARALGLAGVHFWSVDRDQACPAGEPRVSPRCHALPGVPAGSFGRLLGGE
jgi:hypothetical protein